MHLLILTISQPFNHLAYIFDSLDTIKFDLNLTRNYLTLNNSVVLKLNRFEKMEQFFNATKTGKGIGLILFRQ